MLSSHREDAARIIKVIIKNWQGFKPSFANFAPNLLGSKSSSSNDVSIKLVHASVISNITKTAWQSGKKPASVVNTDLYFCQDLQLCQWNWDIRFQDIGGCCSCLCWMKRKFNFLSLIIQTVSQEIHRDVKKILMTIMIAIAFPLSWFFLFQNYHCAIF